MERSLLGQWNKRQTSKLPAFIVLLLFVMTVTGISVARAGEQQKSATGAAPVEYVLGIGDLIEVLVWKEAELSRTLRIRQDGRISLPLIGDVEAAGESPRTLTAHIEEGYRKTISEPSVTVILNQSNHHYYVLGKVKQPGEFPLDADLTVLQALARSGGFLEWAKTADISIIRRQGGVDKLLPFNYDAMINKGELSLLPLLFPGDTIIVP